jgi:hypothetical protein
MSGSKMVVFVHGWSVRSTDTYGRLPDRLKIEATAAGLQIDVKHVYLSKYVSFRDEVRMEDIARAMEAAIASEQDIQSAVAAGSKLVLITHSTGGPVAREWWYRCCVKTKRPCPMSHLIMLAPANFGSALAQLGKSTISRLKSWSQGVQPGQGVLDWLEPGSAGSWDLNESWIRQQPSWTPEENVFQFVLTGQSIDRSMYDYVNSYTGETGSDGVVRVASANLNATYVKLVQKPDPGEGVAQDWRATKLTQAFSKTAPPTAFAVLPGMSHSGDTKGILRSVRLTGKHPTVDAILKCLTVEDAAGYGAVVKSFNELTAATQTAEHHEVEKGLLFSDREYDHPLTTQLIVRLTDDSGYGLRDFDFLLTAWDPQAANPAHRTPSPDLLPDGFLLDRQRNRNQTNCLTFYLNQEVLEKAPFLGIRIHPRPEPAVKAKTKDDFFVHYLTTSFGADARTISGLLRPNSTLLLDIEFMRVVRKGVFRLTTETKAKDFTGEEPDEAIGPETE